MTSTWRTAFLGEVAALSILCAFWLLWPGRHVSWLLGGEPVGSEVVLLEQGLAALMCAWTFFYGALIVRRIDLEVFRLVQQTVALGSVLLLAVGCGVWREANPDGVALAVHLALLTASVALRGTFLARTRQPVLTLEPG